MEEVSKIIEYYSDGLTEEEKTYFFIIKDK